MCRPSPRPGQSRVRSRGPLTFRLGDTKTESKKSNETKRVL